MRLASLEIEQGGRCRGHSGAPVPVPGVVTGARPTPPARRGSAFPRRITPVTCDSGPKPHARAPQSALRRRPCLSAPAIAKRCRRRSCKTTGGLRPVRLLPCARTCNAIKPGAALRWHRLLAERGPGHARRGRVRLREESVWQHPHDRRPPDLRESVAEVLGACSAPRRVPALLVFACSRTSERKTRRPRHHRHRRGRR